MFRNVVIEGTRQRGTVCRVDQVCRGQKAIDLQLRQLQCRCKFTIAQLRTLKGQPADPPPLRILRCPIGKRDDPSADHRGRVIVSGDPAGPVSGQLAENVELRECEYHIIFLRTCLTCLTCRAECRMRHAALRLLFLHTGQGSSFAPPEDCCHDAHAGHHRQCTGHHAGEKFAGTVGLLLAGRQVPAV